MDGFLFGMQMMGGAALACVLLALTMLTVIVVLKWLTHLEYKKEMRNDKSK